MDAAIAIISKFAELIVKFTLAALLGGFTTRSILRVLTKVKRADEMFLRLWTEIDVLRKVVDECHEALDRLEAPAHVRHSIITCFEARERMERLARSAIRNKAPGTSRWNRIRLVVIEKELTEYVATFRARVVLLRDMCSE